MIRTVRANLLDQLEMPYVEAARGRGLHPLRLLLKYPVRIAINPVVSTIGWLLPALVSGSVIVSMVLSLPTTGPLMLTALLNQDMYLAGSFVMLMSVLTVIGTLVSDILLAWVDPRIRFESKSV
jgi:peptide/nickel transport system permease protein